MGSKTRSRSIRPWLLVAALAVAGVLPLVSAAPRTEAAWTDIAVGGAFEARMVTCCVYGVYAYASTPDPAFSPRESWAHSVIGGVGDYDTLLVYAEAGSQKYSNGQRHPYMNVRNKGNLAREHIEVTAENLDPGQYVEYKVFQIGGGSHFWHGTWNGTHFTSSSIFVGVAGFRYMISGLEASCSGCNMGYVALQNNQYDSGSGWKRWCYSSHDIRTKGTFSNPQPTVSVCYGTNTNSWNMLYH